MDSKSRMRSNLSQFFDILYKFEEGKLVTDLFRKETDANRYLEFFSYHPRHTFRSIVNYRRIANEDENLGRRFEELKSFFIESSYPPNIVDEVITDVRSRVQNQGTGLQR